MKVVVLNRGSLVAAAIAATVTLAGPARAADVGVSIGISQPGVYGRIDIGRFPQPVLVAPQPVIIAQPAMAPPPVYLWVPPGHQRHWHRYCGQYNACGVPVYFVQERWYREHVMRGERDGRYDGRAERRPQERYERREERRDDRQDDRGGDRGRGHERRD